MKKIILILLFALNVTLLSQGGSNYSIFGVGDLYHANGAKYEALSNTAIAFPHQTGINLENPAMWSENTDTRIQLGYKFNQSLVSNETQDLYQNNGGLDGLLTVFNLDTAMGASISMGFYSYTNVNSLIATPVLVTKNGESITGITTNEGAGGITRAYFGFSIKPIDMLSVGVQVFGNTGLIENRIQSVFNENNAFSTYTEIKDGIGGSGFKFGLALEPTANLRVGAYFEPASSFTIERDLTYGSGLVDDISFVSNSEFELPNNLGIGASYATGKFVFGLDYQTSDYSSFQYNSLSTVEYSNYNSYSLGILRVGNDSPNAKGLDTWGYSLGASYKNQYYTVNGFDITEMAASAGFTIPIKGTAELDAAFTFGQRGSTDNGLIKESFGRLSVNISIGDTWFQPFNRSYE